MEHKAARPEDMIRFAAKMYGFLPKDVVGPSHSRSRVRARKVAAAIMRRAGFSYWEVAQFLNRNYTTARRAILAVEGDDNLKRTVNLYFSK